MPVHQDSANKTTHAPRSTASGREIELKLDVRAEDRASLEVALKALPGVVRRRAAQRLTTAYFDTPDHALEAAGASLRIRRKGSGRIQTIKSGPHGAGLFDRSEIERRIRSDTPSLTDDERNRLGAVLGGDPPADEALVQVFATAVRRVLFDAARGDSTIEIAIDEASIEADGRVVDFVELELELKSGDGAELFGLVRELADVAPLRIAGRSKSARGYELVQGDAPRSYKGVVSPVSPGMDVEASIRAIASDCLSQFRLNEDLLLADARSSPLHRARVALRRLRSAFALFKAAVAGPQAEALRAELKWLAGELGEARDIDVFVKERLSGKEPSETETLDPQLHGMVDARRMIAYADALAALNSERALKLALDLVEWLEIGDWRSAPSTEDLRRGSAEDFAAKAIEKATRRLKKRGKGLASLPVAERHQARIAAKKLRYACEFFAPLYEGREGKRHAAFLKRLTDLQDRLGALNDVAATTELTRKLAREAGEDRAGDVAFSAGMLAGAAEARAEKQIGKSEESLAKLLDAKPFWR